ncbi:MAG: alpha/beta hydrolase, partial [Pseudomonadota bacterium]
VSRPVLVGHSLGGAIVLAMALERPEQVGALVLLTPLTHPVAKPNPIFDGLRVRSRLLRRLLGYTIAVPLARQKTKETLDEVFAPEPWPEDFGIRAGGVLGLRPKGYVTTSGDLVAVEDEIEAQAGRYGTLKMPGFVLLADGDTLLPNAEQGSPLSEHGFTIETLTGRGHMLPLTAPDDCAKLIRTAVAQAAKA